MIKIYYYGIPSERALVDYIDIVCNYMPHKEARRRLLIATAYQETKFAEYRDRTQNKAGEGIFQFDPSVIEDTLNRIPKGVKDLYEKTFDIDFSEVTHRTLNNMPLIATILTAFKYYLVPKRLPDKDDFEGMWHYYKKWFNSYEGKATKEEFRDSWEFALLIEAKYFK